MIDYFVTGLNSTLHPWYHPTAALINAHFATIWALYHCPNYTSLQSRCSIPIYMYGMCFPMHSSQLQLVLPSIFRATYHCLDCYWPNWIFTVTTTPLLHRGKWISQLQYISTRDSIYQQVFQPMHQPPIRANSHWLTTPSLYYCHCSSYGWYRSPYITFSNLKRVTKHISSDLSLSRLLLAFLDLTTSSHNNPFLRQFQVFSVSFWFAAWWPTIMFRN
jgi:hypothetical protein